jgi:hypothetical protein
VSILKKSSKLVSSRSQIQIDGVKDGILHLPKGKYRLVLETSSINFELKSEEEQDAIVDTYQTFLNSLNIEFQILVRTRELDMDKYLSGFEARTEKEADDIYRKQSKSYIRFVNKLITNNKILTRKFYIIVPFSSSTKDDSLVEEQLKQQADIIAKGLGRLGMQVRKLDSLEVLDLFYSFYSPKQAKRQPLKQQTISLLKESYL